MQSARGAARLTTTTASAVRAAGPAEAPKYEAAASAATRGRWSRPAAEPPNGYQSAVLGAEAKVKMPPAFLKGEEEEEEEDDLR